MRGGSRERGSVQTVRRSAQTSGLRRSFKKMRWERGSGKDRYALPSQAKLAKSSME
jgi:hypothetical protein